MSDEVFREPKYIPAKWFYFSLGIVASISVYEATERTKQNLRIDALEHISPTILDEMNRRSDKRDAIFDRLVNNVGNIDSKIGAINERLSHIEGRLRMGSNP